MTVRLLVVAALLLGAPSAEADRKTTPKAVRAAMRSVNRLVATGTRAGWVEPELAALVRRAHHAIAGEVARRGGHRAGLATERRGANTPLEEAFLDGAWLRVRDADDRFGRFRGVELEDGPVGSISTLVSRTPEGNRFLEVSIEPGVREKATFLAARRGRAAQVTRARVVQTVEAGGRPGLPDVELISPARGRVLAMRSHLAYLNALADHTAPVVRAQILDAVLAAEIALFDVSPDAIVHHPDPMLDDVTASLPGGGSLRTLHDRDFGTVRLELDEAAGRSVDLMMISQGAIRLRVSEPGGKTTETRIGERVLGTHSLSVEESDTRPVLAR